MQVELLVGKEQFGSRHRFAGSAGLHHKLKVACFTRRYTGDGGIELTVDVIVLQRVVIEHFIKDQSQSDILGTGVADIADAKHHRCPGSSGRC